MSSVTQFCQRLKIYFVYSSKRMWSLRSNYKLLTLSRRIQMKERLNNTFNWTQLETAYLLDFTLESFSFSKFLNINNFLCSSNY